LAAELLADLVAELRWVAFVFEFPVEICSVFCDCFVQVPAVLGEVEPRSFGLSLASVHILHKLFDFEVLLLVVGQCVVDVRVGNDELLEVVYGIGFDLVALLELVEGDVVSEGEPLDCVAILDCVHNLFGWLRGDSLLVACL
jgi:hypothetical protein